jgi:hypothetical protein
MSQGPAVDVWQQIDADQIARIDISRDAHAEQIEVRVHMTGVEKPHVFAFGSMADAIAFYEQLWSRRTGDGNNAAASHTA